MESWAPDAVPSREQIAHVVERPEDPAEELAAYDGPAYGARLYG